MLAEYPDGGEEERGATVGSTARPTPGDWAGAARVVIEPPPGSLVVPGHADVDPVQVRAVQEALLDPSSILRAKRPPGGRSWTSRATMPTTPPAPDRMS